MTPPVRTVRVRGAREHNLKGVDLEFPRDALVTFTGVSGSGKSSLAHSTIYQEGQRRFLESLSAYARQFLGRMEKPRVDAVEGLSPTVSIDQKSVGSSPRSTVGTLTEVQDFLRLAWSRLGEPACPECGTVVESWSVDRIVAAIGASCDGHRALVLAPVVRERKGEYRQELQQYRARGFVRARIDGEVRRLDEDIELHRYKYHTIELVVDRLRVSAGDTSRLAEAVEQALALADGTVAIRDEDAERDEVYSTARACPNGHGALPELEPRLFSFNSPVGACPHCDGLGEVHSFDPELLVQDEDATLRDGALAGFSQQGRLLFGRLGLDHLQQVGEALGFDLDTPWKKLGKRHQKTILHGSGSKTFDFRWRKEGRNHAASGKLRTAWPGIVPHLESVYAGTTKHALDRYRRSTTCPECDGARINAVARGVRFEGHALPEILGWPLADTRTFFDEVELHGSRAAIGSEILREIRFRLGFLSEVGLGYLSLDRRANTLSGGESQRIRLAAQVGSGLRGILYVLDEPSIGLHHRDQTRLIRTLKALRDRGNSVLVVEHDEETMRASDWLVDVGPLAGVKGGEVVASGPPDEVAEADPRRSHTAAFLKGIERIEVPDGRRPVDPAQVLRVVGAAHHNLQDVTVEFPLGIFVAVTGVSGSGKSTLVNHILKRALRRDLMKANDVPGRHKRIEGLQHLDKIIEIDQSPIGRTPRSNPATYTGLWDHVRDLFAALPESRLREYKKGRFSFNVPGGRCAACEGAGVRLLEMQFLAPVEVVCEECDGLRFNPETLEVEFKGHNVAQVLDLSIDAALELFAAIPKIQRPLQTLQDVGLGYLTLGQTSTTLSGGEAQRVKLATELHRPATGRTLYILDEPTTGLHFEDVRRLLACLQALVDGGNSVVVIEHDLDVIKCADHLIDMGPEGGPGGGKVIAQGTPEAVAGTKDCHTGRALAPILGKRAKGRKPKAPPRAASVAPPTHIEVRGARQNNLQAVDVSIPLDSFTVITGPSGSGKTSLAFDTIFGEGQRRFVESLSTYARRFLGRMDRAPVDSLDGLGPAIAIDQKAASRSPRSTVATATEIQDYLRLLYARVGRPHCPTHGQELEHHPPHKIARELEQEFGGRRGYVLAPFAVPESLREDPKQRAHYLEELRASWKEQGFVRCLVDGVEHRLDEPIPAGDAEQAPVLHLVVDRTKFDDRSRLTDSAAQAAALAHGRVVARTAEKGEEPRELLFSTDRSCPHCGHSVPKDPHPRWFSFNHHSGACGTCAGLGRVVTCVPELLVNHPEKATFRGAIKHKGAAFTFLTNKNGWYVAVARAVAERYGFDLDAPWHELPEPVKKILLRGTGEERYQVRFTSKKSGGTRTWDMAVKWKGLAAQIEHWYHGHDPQQAPERFAAVMREAVCPDCEGQRLGAAQRSVLVGGMSLPDFATRSVDDALAATRKLKLRKAERTVAQEVLREIEGRLRFLEAVGLGYLSLDRNASTLSGGEAQRIRLATQLGNQLVGVLYVLDEPTIGLHPRDTDRLLETLQELRDLGNTVVAVEHDAGVIQRADWVVDMGPGAGHKGGRVVATGTPTDVAQSDGLTGRYLRGVLAIPLPTKRRAPIGWLTLDDCTTHNLKGFAVEVPLGVLCAVTGVSGSGKSTLVLDTLVPRMGSGEYGLRENDARDDHDEDLDRIETVVVDQSPIGTTPSSNPATYVGVLTPIRELFAKLPQSRVKGFGPGRFSFNIAEGRCDACEGKGFVRVEMHFLADVWIRCETCHGRRYNAETLSVELRGKTIADVLEMEASEALDFFGDHPKIRRPLKLLDDVGLGYLKLGQPANTLSGGEAQRIKLVASLTKRPRGHVFHILDEPTTGLHLDDVEKLVRVLQRLVDRGDTVLVVEHHLDVVKCADHVIELGPEAGPKGGELVFTGSPEQMARSRQSRTGPYLKPLLNVRAGKLRQSEKEPDETKAVREGAAP